MVRFSLQEPVMRRVNLAGFTLLALGLATGLVVVSCQDQRSVTEAPRAPRADAIAGSATAVISPSGDTYLNINAVNAAGEPTLNLYTWPDNKIANAVVMKFDLASIPAGSTISSATLNLNLVESDGMTEPTYTVSAHKIVSKNPDLSRATGYTYDGVNSWTPNACCYGNIPLAQADISAPVDTKDIDKTPGFKQWDVTSIVQGWFSSPSTNFGLLLNSDPAKLRDRYRSFSSTEDPVASTHPYLTVVYTPPPAQPPAGQGSLVFPPAGDTYLNINATNSGAEPTLNVYKWTDAKIANAIVIKFDLECITAGSTISSATLNLNLVESDAMAQPTYTVTAHRTAAAGGAARTMVVGDPGADRAAACSPAARRQGAELGTQRRPASVGSEHGNLYGRTESLVAVLRRPRFPPRRATPRRRWAHYGRAWPTEHEPVRSQHGFVADRAADGIRAMVSDQHHAAQRRRAHRRRHRPERRGRHDPGDLERDELAPAHDGERVARVLCGGLRGAGRGRSRARSRAYG